MRKTLILTSLLFGPIGCDKGEDTDETQTETGDTGDTGQDGYPSSFTSGQFRVTEFAILADGVGVDLDGDEVPDNNLPTALVPVDLFVSDFDLSADGLNAQIATALADDDLIALMEAVHASGVLTFDILAGQLVKEQLVVDVENSYTEGGEPYSRLVGQFSTEVDFDVSSDQIRVPVTFFPGEPPLLVPLQRAQVVGQVDGEQTVGMIAGVIPAQSLVDEVIDPMVPAEGLDTDGDGAIDLTKEELLELLYELASLEHIADIELAEGERGVSSAFGYTSPAVSFTTPTR